MYFGWSTVRAIKTGCSVKKEEKGLIKIKESNRKTGLQCSVTSLGHRLLGWHTSQSIKPPLSQPSRSRRQHRQHHDPADPDTLLLNPLQADPPGQVWHCSPWELHWSFALNKQHRRRGMQNAAPTLPNNVVNSGRRHWGWLHLRQKPCLMVVLSTGPFETECC